MYSPEAPLQSSSPSHSSSPATGVALDPLVDDVENVVVVAIVVVGKETDGGVEGGNPGGGGASADGLPMS